MLNYRIAIFDDLPRIVEIYNSIVASRMVTADLETVSVESRIDWFYEHHPSKHPIWIVQTETGEIVGWLSFTPFHSRCAYDITSEISIYLDEQFRGKGFGKEILNYAIHIAPNFGIRNIVGLIFGHNVPSLNLFKHFGFEEWGNLPKVALLDNIERDLIILGKPVSN